MSRNHYFSGFFLRPKFDILLLLNKLLIVGVVIIKMFTPRRHVNNLCSLAPYHNAIIDLCFKCQEDCNFHVEEQ